MDGDHQRLAVTQPVTVGKSAGNHRSVARMLTARKAVGVLNRHPRSPPPISPTHRTSILGSGKMGEMEKDGGKGEKWRKMEENGGE